MSTETRPTVVEALSLVMDDVQAVRKADRNTQQNFSFRGIDSVVNAVGPALRKHGVVAVPVGVVPTFESYQSRQGAQMRNCVLSITWRFYGPLGDHIEAVTLGEASDAGDKSVPKAHSVAYRILLLQALCIPTDEPDPDASAHERAAPRARSGRDWTADASAAGSVEALGKLWREAVAAGEMTDGIAAHITALSDALKADSVPPRAEDVLNAHEQACGEMSTFPVDGDDPWQTPVTS